MQQRLNQVRTKPQISTITKTKFMSLPSEDEAYTVYTLQTDCCLSPRHRALNNVQAEKAIAKVVVHSQKSITATTKSSRTLSEIF